jgi:hypothetical protein
VYWQKEVSLVINQHGNNVTDFDTILFWGCEVKIEGWILCWSASVSHEAETETWISGNTADCTSSLGYTLIPEVFFAPLYVGPCCTKVIRGRHCVFRHLCTNVIVSNCCATLSANEDIILLIRMWLSFHCCTIIGPLVLLLLKTQQTHGRARNVLFAHDL